MAPSGEKLLEANVACFSGGSLKDKLESNNARNAL